MKERGASAETITADAKDDSYAKQMLVLGCKLNSSDCKILGISRNYKNDNLIFNFERLADSARKTPLTKRNLLRPLASMFDPLGIISPLIIQMKMLFLELYWEQLDWDTNLEGRDKQKWDDWIKGLSEIEKIAIGRCIYKAPKQKIVGCFAWVW